MLGMLSLPSMKATPPAPPDSFRRFKDTLRALLTVPKHELDEQAEAWKKRRKKKVAARRRQSA